MYEKWRHRHLRKLQKKGGIMAKVQTKTIWESKTFWLNLIGALVIILQLITSTHLVVDTDVQSILLAVLNILLRFKTNTAVTLR